MLWVKMFRGQQKFGKTILGVENLGVQIFGLLQLEWSACTMGKRGPPLAYSLFFLSPRRTLPMVLNLLVILTKKEDPLFLNQFLDQTRTLLKFNNKKCCAIIFVSFLNLCLNQF